MDAAPNASVDIPFPPRVVVDAVVVVAVHRNKRSAILVTFMLVMMMMPNDGERSFETTRRTSLSFRCHVTNNGSFLKILHNLSIKNEDIVDHGNVNPAYTCSEVVSTLERYKRSCALICLNSDPSPPSDTEAEHLAATVTTISNPSIHPLSNTMLKFSLVAVVVALTLTCCHHLIAPPVQAFASVGSGGGTRRRSVSTTTESTTTSTTTSTTALYISSWGTKGPPAFRQASRLDPEKRIQDYLPEPGPVEARTTIDGTILVSGLIVPKQQQDAATGGTKSSADYDQFLFDLLNHQDSAFEFTKIIAFVPDAAFAKKRLLSRSARYTGLLDKLSFVQAEKGQKFPTVDQLAGVKTWLAVLHHNPDDNIGGSGGGVLADCHELSDICAQISATELQSVAVLLTHASDLDPAQCLDVVHKLNATEGRQCTIVAVGQLEDRPEGSTAYQYEAFGTPEGVLPAKAVFAREEAYRMITELLQLECGVGKAYSFAEVYNVNATESKLVRGLREAGYARPQEIDHMIRLGPKVRKKDI
jgi:hypothetical protein